MKAMIEFYDYRSLSAPERAAVRAQLIKRAHLERAEFIRTQMRALFGSLDRLVEMVLRAVFAPKVRVPPSRRA
ncbi:MAG TPA: hypothetical protein VMH84_09730 [Xanthobacteraceae bacterium]|nr:hypothetical protein [Xanthobacteraceae bacterium]